MSAEAVKTVIEIGMALEQVKQKFAEKDDRIAALEAELKDLKATHEIVVAHACDNETRLLARADKAEAEVKHLEEVQGLTYRRAQHLDDRANRAEALVRELVEALEQAKSGGIMIQSSRDAVELALAKAKEAVE